MTADSLSTVFSPNLLRSADDDVSFFFANMSAAHRAMKILITHVSLSLCLSTTADIVRRVILYSATSSRISTQIKKRKMNQNTITMRHLYQRKMRKRLTLLRQTTSSAMTMCCRRQNRRSSSCLKHLYSTLLFRAHAICRYLCPHNSRHRYYYPITFAILLLWMYDAPWTTLLRTLSRNLLCYCMSVDTWG